MTDTAKTPWIRLRGVRPLLEWFTQDAISECALAVHVLPDDVLADREALAACLTEQLRHLSRRKIEYLETHWQAAWEKDMAGQFIIGKYLSSLGPLNDVLVPKEGFEP